MDVSSSRTLLGGSDAIKASLSENQFQSEMTGSTQFHWIGQGGQSKVGHLQLSETDNFAVKVYKFKDRESQKSLLEKLERERLTWQRVSDHPNVIQVRLI